MVERHNRRQRVIIWVGALALAAVTLACNAFAGRANMTLPVPPTALPTSGAVEPGGDGSTIAPTVTLPGSVPVPDGAAQLLILVDLNIRSGPGVQFRRVGFLLRGETVPVIGRDEPSGWWQIACPPTADGPECWVSGGSQYTRLEEPTPTATP